MGPGFFGSNPPPGPRLMSDSTDPFRVRPAANRDLPAIRQIVFGVLREYGLEPDPDGTDADLADVEASYLGRGGVFEVVQQQDGRIVGTVGLFPVNRRRAELRKMYLLPGARGRGLGKRLLERMLDTARRLGFREVLLETNSVLKEAIGLYEKYGFEPIAMEHVAPRCDQVYLLLLEQPAEEPPP